MKPSSAVSSATVLVAVAFALQAAADQTARLTIGGYMPPRQRVVALQPVATTTQTRGIRLLIQSTGGANFILAADWKDIQTGSTRPAGWRAWNWGLDTPGDRWQPGMSSGLAPSPQKFHLTQLEIEQPAEAGCCLRLTIASR